MLENKTKEFTIQYKIVTCQPIERNFSELIKECLCRRETIRDTVLLYDEKNTLVNIDIKEATEEDIKRLSIKKSVRITNRSIYDKGLYLEINISGIDGKYPAIKSSTSDIEYDKSPKMLPVEKGNELLDNRIFIMTYGNHVLFLKSNSSKHFQKYLNDLIKLDISDSPEYFYKFNNVIDTEELRKLRNAKAVSFSYKGVCFAPEIKELELPKETLSESLNDGIVKALQHRFQRTPKSVINSLSYKLKIFLRKNKYDEDNSNAMTEIAEGLLTNEEEGISINYDNGTTINHGKIIYQKKFKIEVCNEGFIYFDSVKDVFKEYFNELNEDGLIIGKHVKE